MSDADKSAARRLRRAVKDLMWRTRGVGIRNPPLPADVRSILFVCTGNICRSPFAAAHAQRLVDAGGRHTLRCQSAGLRPSADGACPPDAVRAAGAYGTGAALSSHRPIGLTDELVDAYDLMVVMDAAHLSELHRCWPHARPRVVLLPLFERGTLRRPYERFNILDPFGKGPAVFEHVFRQIDASIRGLLADLH